MKKILTLASALTIALSGPILSQAEEETPIIPVGTLSAFPTIVQTGTHPQLTWDITLPETIDDVVEIDPPGTIVPKRCLIMDVRVLGAAVQTTYFNGAGKITKKEWRTVECQTRYNGGSYSRIFYDTHDDVFPNQIVHTQKVEKNSRVDFGARYVQTNGYWSTWFSSTNSSHNVVALKNGDTPPTTTPMYQQPTIESFLIPYLDDNGNIKLGARDVIYLMELTHTDKNNGGFDLQDMALLVTFYDSVETPEGTMDCEGNIIPNTNDDTDDDSGDDADDGKSNNGHGNNVDGVDSSNPGNSKDGEDSDPTVDDEKKRGRRKK